MGSTLEARDGAWLGVTREKSVDEGETVWR